MSSRVLGVPPAAWAISIRLRTKGQKHRLHERRFRAAAQRFAGVACCVAILLGGCGGGANPPAPARETREITSANSAATKRETQKGNGTLRIAAASDLKFAIEDIVTAFNRQHQGALVTATFGSSGNFFAQISNKAPFDLFLSADLDYARRLVEQGHGPPGSEFAYARGFLVLWTLHDSPLDVQKSGAAPLSQKEIKAIAIANPKTAPYGRAAVQALQTLGLYDVLEPKLVYGESVSHAAQMVESGAADVGIIALSLAVSPALRDRGKFWSFPEDAYAPIVQGGVVLSWAEDPALAGEFRVFLLSGQGLSILKDYGFGAPQR